MEPTPTGPEPITAFIETQGVEDSKTIAAYHMGLRAFVNWLAQQPGGQPFLWRL